MAALKGAPAAPKKSERRGLWLRVLGTLASLALLAWLLVEQGWGEISAAFQRIPPAHLAGMAGLMIVSRLAVAARWHVLLRSGGARVGWAESFKLTFAGLFATNFLPTTIGGDVVRLVGALRLGVESGLAAASLVADRLIGMAGMLLALPWGLPYLWKMITAARPTGAVWLAAAPVGWADRLWQKARAFAAQTLAALARWLRRPDGLLFSFGYTWVHMLCFFGILWLSLGGMGEALPFTTVAGLWTLVYFVTLLPVSINGYGLQELSVTLVYSQLAGVSREASLTAALILRTLTMLASLPGALYLPGLMQGRTEETTTIAEDGGNPPQ